jgi:hypothetical protein
MELELHGCHFLKKIISKSTFVSYKRNKNENPRGRYW